MVNGWMGEWIDGLKWNHIQLRNWKYHILSNKTLSVRICTVPSNQAHLQLVHQSVQQLSCSLGFILGQCSMWCVSPPSTNCLPAPLQPAFEAWFSGISACFVSSTTNSSVLLPTLPAVHCSALLDFRFHPQQLDCWSLSTFMLNKI